MVFPIKFNAKHSKLIHTLQVDLHALNCFKKTKMMISCFLSHASNSLKMDTQK